MATLDVKSNVITTLDAPPPVLQRLSAGSGGAAHIQRYEATVIPSATPASASYYPMIRLPSNAIVKRVAVAVDVLPGTFTADVTLFFSDNAMDGTDANAGVGLPVNSLTGASAFFANAFVFGTAGPAAGVLTDLTYKNVAAASGYKPSTSILPLWQAAGLPSDPAGFFDVSFLLTAAGATASVKITMQVDIAVIG